MAIFNEILSARFARMLQKLFSMKGPPPVRALAGEITPAIGMFSGVENRYLEGWERFARRFFVAAVAAQNGDVRIRNPLGSNTIVVIEKIIVENTVSHEFVVQLQAINTDQASLQVPPGFQIDGRTRPQGTAVTSQTTLAALPNTSLIYGGAVQAGGAIDMIQNENQELTLLPGFSLDIADATVNQAFAVSLLWRERPLEESERT